MIPRLRRWTLFVLAVLSFVYLFRQRIDEASASFKRSSQWRRPLRPHCTNRWRDLPQRYPVHDFISLPAGPSSLIPRIQFQFPAETAAKRRVRVQRLRAVKAAFKHSWNGYKSYAWMQDEVGPVSGQAKNGFAGWAATLVDSLDTLWIMGLHDDFRLAVDAVGNIDFTTTVSEDLNVFETTIRYLGGLLSAYDLSEQRYPILLHKAVELGDMLYAAFDTPNRMPVARWDWNNTLQGGSQQGTTQALLAEIGSLSLEFTRLSQLTGEAKWYDAVARVTDVFAAQQDQAQIPGLWPMHIDTLRANFHQDRTFTLSGQADSFYEYLPKQHLLLGGRTKQYRDMYLAMLPAAKQHLFFAGMNPENRALLFSGTAERHPALSPDVIPEVQHLTCFVGGMVALGAKVFGQPGELQTAKRLVDGCVWAYETMPSGIMPESFYVAPCRDATCTWSEADWLDTVAQHARAGAKKPLMNASQALQHVKTTRVPRGMTKILHPEFYLRPEAIESVFILYRVTGDPTLLEQAWEMFLAITRATKTEIAFASLLDVKQPAGQPMTFIDEMQSFWTAETLKYFYLIFSEPDVVSLDDHVFNTEAHPLLRPK